MSKKITLDTEKTTLSQRRFIRIFSKTGDYRHAAAKCFPEKEDPIKYAAKILNDTNYQRALIEYHCDSFGVTDEFLIKTLKQGIDQMHWNDPKSARTKLDVIRELFKLKGRYPQEASQSITFNQKNVSATINMDSAKEKVLSEIWDRSKKNMTTEQIKDVIIDAEFEEKTKKPVHTKEQLFLQPPESVDVEDDPEE